jgi:hypothetical protein
VAAIVAATEVARGTIAASGALDTTSKLRIALLPTRTIRGAIARSWHSAESELTKRWLITFRMDHAVSTLEETRVTKLICTALLVLRTGISAATLPRGPTVLAGNAIAATPTTAIVTTDPTNTVGNTTYIRYVDASGTIKGRLQRVWATRRSATTRYQRKKREQNEDIAHG